MNTFVSSTQFPSDRGILPQTINSSNFIETILQHGPCKPVGPFEKGKDWRPVCSEAFYSFYSSGNLKVDSNWLCFSLNLDRPYCEPCWLLADRCNLNLYWQ